MPSLLPIICVICVFLLCNSDGYRFKHSGFQRQNTSTGTLETMMGHEPLLLPCANSRLQSLQRRDQILFLNVGMEANIQHQVLVNRTGPVTARRLRALWAKSLVLPQINRPGQQALAVALGVWMGSRDAEKPVNCSGVSETGLDFFLLPSSYKFFRVLSRTPEKLFQELSL